MRVVALLVGQVQLGHVQVQAQAGHLVVDLQVDGLVWLDAHHLRGAGGQAHCLSVFGKHLEPVCSGRTLMPAFGGHADSGAGRSARQLIGGAVGVHARAVAVKAARHVVELHADLRAPAGQRLARLQQEGHAVPARVVDEQRHRRKRGAPAAQRREAHAPLVSELGCGHASAAGINPCGTPAGTAACAVSSSPDLPSGTVSSSR